MRSSNLEKAKKKNTMRSSNLEKAKKRTLRDGH